MLQDQRTLVIIADGARARVFEEARRGGHLIEHADWLADLLPKSGHDSAGHGTHGRHAQPAGEKTESAFLTKLCDRVESLMGAHDFDALIVIAAPRALGVLRQVMSKALHQRLAQDQAHDRLDATPEMLVSVIHDMRRASA